MPVAYAPSIPTPADLGIAAFNPGQAEAAQFVLDAWEGLAGIDAPTGFGKSLIPAMTWLATGLRVGVLTHTKGLQTQYQNAFAASLGLADVRGKVSYTCNEDKLITALDGACEGCRRFVDGCDYYDAVRGVRRSPFFVTNYAAHFSHNKFGQGLGPIDILFLDEADVALDALSDFLSVTIQRSQIRRITGLELPVPSDAKKGVYENQDAVRDWAKVAYAALPKTAPVSGSIHDDDGMGVVSRSLADRRRKREIEELRQYLDALIGMKGGWVIWRAESRDGTNTSLQAQPVEPERYLESVLYQWRAGDRGGRVPKVVLMSATLPEPVVKKMAQGQPYAYRSFPSAIPVHNRQITHLRTTNMSRGRADVNAWVMNLDYIVGDRLDRKGVIHTTSYSRRSDYLLKSRYAGQGIFLSHDSRDIEQAVQEFKRRSAPCVLVSPSLVRGFDFPDDDCRYLVVGKVPFPPPDPIVEARRKVDPDYAAMVAAQVIQQEVGRGARHIRDWCEIFITDDDWTWFSRNYAAYFTRAFLEAVNPRSMSLLPSPRPLR